MNSLPTSWEDIKGNLLRKILPLVWQMKYMGDDYDSALDIGRKMLFYFLGFSKKSKKEREMFSMTDKEVIDAMKSLLWLFDSQMTKRPFSFIKVAGIKRYLPKENFADTNGIEMAMANMYYLMFASSASNVSTDGKDTAGDAYRYLWIFLAIICRPALQKSKISSLLTSLGINKVEDIRRVGFDNTEAENVALEFEKLPIGESLAILGYWESQQKIFMDQYSNVLKGGDGEPLFANGEGWIVALEDVAKDRVHGDFEKVCETNCHTLWTYLSHQKTIADAQQKAK